MLRLLNAKSFQYEKNYIIYNRYIFSVSFIVKTMFQKLTEIFEKCKQKLLINNFRLILQKNQVFFNFINLLSRVHFNYYIHRLCGNKTSDCDLHKFLEILENFVKFSFLNKTDADLQAELKNSSFFHYSQSGKVKSSTTRKRYLPNF